MERSRLPSSRWIPIGGGGPWRIAFLPLLLALAGPLVAQEVRKDGPGTRSPILHGSVVGPEVAAPAVLRSAVLDEVDEEEPNDEPTDANPVAVGDVVAGEVDPEGDADHFVFDVEEGTRLVLDLHAQALGSPLDPTLTLLDADGNEVAFNDDFNGLDSRVTLEVASGGSYFAVVGAFAGGGGPGHVYELAILDQEPGPGDPTSLYAGGFVLPWGMAAGPGGELYVADYLGGIVHEVAADGTVSTLASGLNLPFDLVLDGFGDLLVTELGEGRILRIDLETGDRTTFAELVNALPLTVGPEGQVWIGAGSSLFRYDERGTLLEELPLGQDVVPGILTLAFSPTGVLHLSNELSAVFRLEDGQAVPVLQGEPAFQGMGFDQDGRLYVANGALGRVQVYGPGYELVNEGFAVTNIGGPSNLKFLRDESGAMTPRIVVSNGSFGLEPPYAGAIVELNPAELTVPGARVGVDFLPVVAGQLPGATMGEEYSHRLTLEDGLAAATWFVVEGDLAPGLTLDAGGTISGVPEDDGSFQFRVRAERAQRFGEAPGSLLVSRPAVSTAAVSDAVLGVGGALNADEERFLDLLGNGNGGFDVGDYLLFLRDQGIVTSSLSPANFTREERDHR